VIACSVPLEQSRFTPMMRGDLFSAFVTWKRNRPMPFYEYECSACKFYVESLQKISDPPLTKCPSCGKETMQRLISAPVFRLKGAGWYETDFKSDGENKRNLADDKEPAAAASDSDDKKVKVRASKALKKVAAKKSAKQPAKKAAKKLPARKKVATKPAKKSVTKTVRKAAKKTAKKVAKKSARKVATKAVKKAAKKK
jgi:putative FmdB family regulatory protein